VSLNACATTRKSEPVKEPTLLARAILPADAYQPGPPILLPGVQSPQNPYLSSPEAWTLGASQGFEGTALSPDGIRSRSRSCPSRPSRCWTVSGC